MKYPSIYFFVVSFSFSFGAELLKEAHADPAYVQAFRGCLADKSELSIEKNDFEFFINQTRSLVNQAHQGVVPGVKLEQLAFGTEIRVGVGPDKKIFYCWFATTPGEIAQHKLQDGNNITSIIASQDNKTIGAIINTSDYNGRFGSFVCLSVFDVSKYTNGIISIKKLYTRQLIDRNLYYYGQITVALTDTHAHIGNTLERGTMKQILLRPKMDIEGLTQDQKKFLEELYKKYLKKCEDSPYDRCVIGNYSPEYKIYKTLPDSVKNWIQSIVMVSAD